MLTVHFPGFVPKIFSFPLTHTLARFCHKYILSPTHRVLSIDKGKSDSRHISCPQLTVCFLLTKESVSRVAFPVIPVSGHSPVGLHAVFDASVVIWLSIGKELLRHESPVDKAEFALFGLKVFS